MTFQSITELALEEMRAKSKNRLYQRDFQAWKWDVLGYRTYEKMRQIGDEVLFGPINRSLTKSGNGSAKSFEMSCMIGWAACVFEPGESISIVSAPTIPQIEKITFQFLKANYNQAIDMGHPMPGRIDEELGWVYDGPSGKIWLATGRKPADRDATTTFQGLRSRFGRTFVWFEETGGMSRQMFTGAEAVLTGEDARFWGIFNPDNIGTEVHRIYTDPRMSTEYNLTTINAFELPTLTGERVYPETEYGDRMEAIMRKAMTTPEWVEHKKRIWGERDARYQSKVMGEFPAEGDTAFFPQHVITLAQTTEVPVSPDARPVLGVDVARYGQDETVVYENRGGRVRLIDTWGKTDTVETARKVHKIANDLAAIEVRIDSAGIGGGVYDQLAALEEFRAKTYLLIGLDGGTRSPDPSRWANSRAYNHDSLREQMMKGLIDLDFDDRELADQLLGVTFKFNVRGAVQITPKDEMRTVMDGSPDRLDAVIYATVDLEWLTGNPLNQLSPGQKVMFEASSFDEDMVGLPYMF